MKKAVTCLLIQALISTGVFAEPISVIVSSNSKIEQVTEVDIARLYLGRTSRVSGQSVVPIDFKNELEVAQKFQQRVLKKTPLQFQQYWARLLFTGRAKPPLSSIESHEEMIDYIAANENTIGYTVTTNIPDKIRVVLIIQ